MIWSVLLSKKEPFFIPDQHGRMPSVIAAELETSEEMQDYVAEQELKSPFKSTT